MARDGQSGRRAVRDSSRAAVYAAEDQFCALLDRGGAVDFHGSVLDLPAERRFGDVAAVQRYLDAVRDTSWGFTHVPRPVVRRRRGPKAAVWHAPAEIAVPEATRWALREVVVLHEYAHHVNHHANGGAGHDRGFCQLHVELVTGALGPAAGTLLLAGLVEAGAYGAGPSSAS